MTKEQFVKAFEEGKLDTRVKYIAVVVANDATGKREIITFDRTNFDEKLAYYKDKYDENMRLKSFTKIGITNIESCKAVTYVTCDQYVKYLRKEKLK